MDLRPAAPPEAIAGAIGSRPAVAHPTTRRSRSDLYLHRVTKKETARWLS